MKPAGELVGNGWRIVFYRAGDRVAHRVELATGDDYRPLLESAEGSPEEAWPASPALQQVHFQSDPQGQRAALLVGMAGRSHWSASVEVGGGRYAAFEAACRIKSVPDWLGSSYRVLGTGSVEQPDVELNASTVLVGPLELRFESPESASQPKWALEGELLRLRVSPTNDAWPQTISWRYVLGLRR